MNRLLLWSFLVSIVVCLTTSLQAQTVLTTGPLNITSTCPGSIIKVPFTLPYLSFTSNTIVTVQLANGGDFFDIPTSRLYINEIIGTVPTSLTPGMAYSVRVISKNPDYVCTPSPTKLFVKGSDDKPPVPLVDSLTVDCMSTNQSSMAGLYSDLFFRLAPGATPRLYYDKQRNSFREDAEYWDYIQLPDGTYVLDKRRGHFQITKTGATSTTYVLYSSTH